MDPATFGLGVMVGFGVMIYVFTQLLRRASMQNVRVSPVPELITERINEMIFLYEKNMFLCQATSIEELAKMFNKLHVVKVAQVSHDDNIIWFVDGEVLNSIESA